MPTTEYGVDEFFQNAGTSPKMVYDVVGVLGWSPHNLAPQSAMGRIGFEWTGNGGTYTGGQADPSGGTQALNVVIPAGAVGMGNNLAQTVLSTVAGQTYTTSAWCKGTAGQQIYFDSNSAASQQLITFTGAWQRVSAVYVAAGINIFVAFECYNRAGGAHLPAVTFQCWGAQANRGPTALAYLPTTTAVRFGLALDYDPVTHAAKGLLCEPQATNLHTYSSDASNGITFEGGTVTANNQLAPDGTLTADTFTEDTAGGVVHASYGNSIFTANADHTYSRFIKMGTRRYATMGWSNGVNGAYAVYDLQSGVVGSSAAIGTGVLNSASMQALPNGWYRCILSAKANATNMYWTCGAATAATITPDGYGRQVFTGTSSTLFMGHAQLEAGTVATSPIPTLVATVTRAADLPTVTPASINYSATAGSWWIDINQLTTATGARIIGHLSAQTPIYTNGPTTFGLYDSAGAFLKTVPSVLGAHKLAAAFASGDRALTADGLAPTTDATAGASLLSPGTYIGIGTETNQANHCYIRKVRYLPRRPTNAELQTMTT